MSNEDTPRTNTFVKDNQSSLWRDFSLKAMGFARKLERELNAANERISELESENNSTMLVLSATVERAEEAESGLAKLSAENAELRKERELEQDFLKCLASDYDHEWPNEDERTRRHRISILNTIRSAMQSEQTKGE